MRLPWIFAVLGCVAAVACANSDNVASTFSVDTGGAGGAGGGGGGAGGASTSSGTSSSGQASSSSTTSSSSSTTSSSSSTTSSSSSSGSSSTSSSTSSSSSGGCSYTAPNTCETALELSEVAGDSGSDLRTVTGTTSKWFKVHIAEASNFDVDLSYTATIEPASGADFDLYIYDGDATNINCFAAPHQANGVPEKYFAEWPDDFGSEDGRWIVLEVRHAGGTGCGSEAKWTMKVQGNTN